MQTLERTLRHMNVRQMLLLEIALVTLIVTAMVFSFTALSVAFDVHQGRVTEAAQVADIERQALRRVDEMMWKTDSALELMGAFKIDFGVLLTKIRAQVKQSSEESSKISRTEARAQTVTIQHALETTNAALAAVAADQPEKAIAAPKPVVVNVPPPSVVMTPPAAPAPQPTAPEEQHKPGIFKRLLLPWKH